MNPSRQDRVPKAKTTLILLAGLFLSGLVHSQQLMLSTDNDVVFETDENYTGGAELTIEFAPWIGLSYRYQLFTPRQTRTKAPPPGDHPYAAFEEYGIDLKYVHEDYVHLAVGLYHARTGEDLDGESIQNGLHAEISKSRSDGEIKIDVSSDLSQGWATQVSNARGYQASGLVGFYQEWRYLAAMAYSEYYGGTFVEYGAYGVSFEAGLGFDGYSLKDKRRDSLFLAFDYQERQVARNNLLEGNEKDYPFAVEIAEKVEVTKLTFVNAAGGFKFLLGYTALSKTYESQKEPPHRFITVGLGYVF